MSRCPFCVQAVVPLGLFGSLSSVDKYKVSLSFDGKVNLNSGVSGVTPKYVGTWCSSPSHCCLYSCLCYAVHLHAPWPWWLSNC